MISISKIYVGAVGLEIILDTEQDITQASKIEMHVRKPDGSLVVWPAIKGLEGRIIHNTIADELKDPGKYRIQAYVEWGNGASKHHGETYTLTVYKEFA